MSFTWKFQIHWAPSLSLLLSTNWVLPLGGTEFKVDSIFEISQVKNTAGSLQLFIVTMRSLNEEWKEGLIDRVFQCKRREHFSLLFSSALPPIFGTWLWSMVDARGPSSFSSISNKTAPQFRSLHTKQGQGLNGEALLRRRARRLRRIIRHGGPLFHKGLLVAGLDLGRRKPSSQMVNRTTGVFHHFSLI